jgi:hypothetical protein
MDGPAKKEGPHAISMHQPWASLLVYGIKRIEGDESTIKLGDPTEITKFGEFIVMLRCSSHSIVEATARLKGTVN